MLINYVVESASSHLSFYLKTSRKKKVGRLQLLKKKMSEKLRVFTVARFLF